jgi:hypothetical protein
MNWKAVEYSCDARPLWDRAAGERGHQWIDHMIYRCALLASINWSMELMSQCNTESPASADNEQLVFRFFL